MTKVWNIGLALCLAVLGVYWAKAQDMAESAALSSQSARAAQGAKAPSVATPGPGKQGASPHLFAQDGPPPDEQNRKEFEQNAGEKAGKLLLRSAPNGADVFINHRIVGRTPLLLIIEPGKYEIDMRGPRGESGHAVVGLMPKETQTVAINLTQRYPSAVSIR